MKVLISYPRNGEKEGRQIAEALHLQGAEVAIDLNTETLPNNDNPAGRTVKDNDELHVVVQPQLTDESTGTESEKPAELDVIAEVREFVQKEMNLLENAEDVDSACEQMLVRCLQFKYARNPAMAAIIHYLKNICRSADESDYYTEYNDQEISCANAGFLESEMN